MIKSPFLYLAKSLKLYQNHRLTFLFNNYGQYKCWFLWIHNSFNYPSSYDWNGIEVKKSFWYTLTYSVQTYHLLESPYSTDCMNYREKTAFLSREDCVRKCRIRESQSKCGVVSNEVDVIRGEPNVRFSKSREEEECTESLDLKEYCYDMCPKDDCLIAHYKPIEISSVEQQKEDSDYMIISLIIPSEPETTYRHKPSVHLIEFLCYMASTLSLWFGVSIFSVIYYLKSIKMNIISAKINVFTNFNKF